jgi:EF hand
MLMAFVGGAVAATAAYGQAKADQAGPKPLPRAQFIASMDTEFRKMDADSNGQVTRAEVEEFERKKAIAAAEAQNSAQFDRLDVNHNGQLSAKEFAKLTPPVTVPSAQPTVARMDVNRDGQVSLVEYRISTLANFDRLDTDRNGIVTPAELKAGGIAPR